MGMFEVALSVNRTSPPSFAEANAMGFTVATSMEIDTSLGEREKEGLDAGNAWAVAGRVIHNTGVA